jgi:hypothetical protein
VRLTSAAVSTPGSAPGLYLPESIACSSYAVTVLVLDNLRNLAVVVSIDPGSERAEVALDVRCSFGLFTDPGD